MKRRRRVTLGTLLLFVALAAVGLYALRIGWDSFLPSLGIPEEAGASSGFGGFNVFALDGEGRALLRPGVTPVSSGGEQVYSSNDIVTRLHRTPWVVVVGTIDHDAIRRSFSRAAQAAGQPDKGDRIYESVELIRQVRRDDGSWGDWEPVDPQPTAAVIDMVELGQPEFYDPTLLAPGLVDFLPYLKEGRWDLVDPPSIAAEVERSLEQQARPVPETGGGAIATAPSVGTGDGPRRLIRKLDLDLVPGRTYRYRVRIVAPDPTVPGPNPPRLVSPWGPQTNPVTVPNMP